MGRILSEMDILVIGDTHFKVSNGSETEQMTRAIQARIQGRRPNYIVVLGDTLDTFAKIHEDPLNRAIAFLDDLHRVAPLILLIGNHDLPNNNAFCSSHHPFNALKKWNQTYVVDEPCRINLEGPGGPYRAIAVPFVAKGRFMEALARVGPISDVDLVFSHQEIRSCRLSHNVFSTSDDVWPQDYPLMIAGHIHGYQVVQPNLIYPGTPIQHTFDDEPDKAIFWLHLQSGTITTSRESLGLRPKITVHLAASDLIASDHRWEPPADSIVKVLLHGTRTDLNACRSSGALRSLQHQGVKIDYRPEVRGGTIDPTPRPYLYRVYEAIRDRPDVVAAFHDLFGRIDLPAVRPKIFKFRIVK